MILTILRQKGNRGGGEAERDAKVPLLAFEKYLGAVTEDDRAGQLCRHLVSLRSHIRAPDGRINR